MDPSGDGSSQVADSSSPSFSLTKINQFLPNIYQDVKYPDIKNNPLNAIAFSDSIIFKELPLDNPANNIKFIQKDIKKIQKNPLIKSIVYISSDLELRDPANKINITSKVNSELAIDIIPCSFFEQSSDNFFDSPYLIDQKLLLKHKTILSRQQNIISIVQRIFDHVCTIPQYQHISKPSEKDFLHLEEKIKVNFASALRKDVHNDILCFWQNKIIIESFIKKSFNHYRAQFNQLTSLVVTSYLSKDKQFSDDEVNDILIFNSIAKEILPPALKDDQDAFLCSKALVYYFFEYCLFGRKSKFDELEFKFQGVDDTAG